MDENDLRKFRKKAEARARRSRLKHEAEDFASEAMLKSLEGSSASIDELWIDYLRTNYGDTRSKYRKDQKRLYPKNVDHKTKLVSTEETGREVNFGCIQRLICENGSWFSQRDRAALTLKYKWGLTSSEIAEAFGVTPSTVTLIFKELETRIRLIVETRPRRKKAG